MSKISDSFSAVVARLELVFPSASGYFQLPNAESSRIGLNSEQLLVKSWALDLGPGQNTLKLLSQQMSIRRQFVVTLTRQWFAKDSDLMGKVDAKLALMEDAFLIIKDLEQDPTVNDPDVVASFKWVSDSGIKPIYSDRPDFIMVQLVFALEYFENLI